MQSAGKFILMVVVIMIAIVAIKWTANKFNIPVLSTVANQV